MNSCGGTWNACWVSSPHGLESRILRWFDKGKWEIVVSAKIEIQLSACASLLSDTAATSPLYTLDPGTKHVMHNHER